MKKWLQRCTVIIASAAILLGGITPAGAAPELNWVEGAGQAIDIGEGLASFTLQEGMIFLNGKDAQTFITETGGKPSGEEIGAVLPAAEDATWGVFIEYTDSGHIKDDEKDKIDADELLQSYKDGTEAANKELDPSAHLFVDSWDIEPAYNEKTKRLTWSLLAHNSSNEKIVNYNERLLTREGYISIVLVSNPEHLAADRVEMEKTVLSSFKVKEGKRYEDFDKSTDKVAEYGLTGLVLGGAGLAVAKKVGFLALILGLFKKFWIVVVAVLAGLWRLITGKKKKDETTVPPSGDDTPQSLT
ncbi:DUF2167 domain-containing protein [Paenibacillus apiarius]|uniref:DUF2167 domain-containing protein n=1 Tax=Paenibacillus apiarius TaxID=46240 RepID=UPI003B3AA21B